MTERRVRASGETVKLRPADPFDLIRWLARSQSDPRKAVAELVQNSIDANARTIRIERKRIRRNPALVIWDDGEGILPELSREEALRTIATNIGHSRKRNLSPRERHEQVVTGKYGIGLLGFWSMGRFMEIRTRVGGSPVSVLRLEEDRERAEIARLATPLDAVHPTYTEVVVAELHEPAQRALVGGRLGEYLAAELRGAILASGVAIEIVDGIARGAAQKRFTVVPRRFGGERLNVPPELDVPGRPPVRVELYLARGDEPPSVQVSCAGTLVADDIAELRALELDRAPWVGCGLVGLLDYPGFNVPPGTRRGVTPDDAAHAFVAAVERLRPLVEEQLRRLDEERGAVRNQRVVQELRRALKGLRNRLPQYELPSVPGETGGPAAVQTPGGPLELPADAPEPESAEQDGETPGAAVGETLPLLPPGPLTSVRIRPELIQLLAGGERRVRAVAFDEAGRRVDTGVVYAWSVGTGFTADGEGAQTTVRATGDLVPGLATTTLSVLATQGERTADGSALVVVVEPRPSETGFGIPEPTLVEEPHATWRSRFDGARWQVNAAHEDYVALRADRRARFRYLLALLAKEIAQRTHGVPGSETALESFVEILAHAERNLRTAG